MAKAIASAPEQGQLVSVRSRNWIVNEVVPSTLPTSGLQGISDPQTLVSLASVEDDGLGEEIQVVWELEPGARLIEKVAVPDPTGFDPPDQLNAFFVAIGRSPLKLNVRRRPSSHATRATTQNVPAAVTFLVLEKMRKA